jgi:hypothetical protein
VGRFVGTSRGHLIGKILQEQAKLGIQPPPPPSSGNATGRRYKARG